MTRMIRRATALAGAVAAAAALTGCGGGGDTVTIEPDDLALDVGSLLQTQVGADAPPALDCGTETLELGEGDTVVCGLSVDGDDGVYDTTVTISEISGTAYRFDAVVADAPR
ncbi:DUF4333 domain-containing protein [Demequina mangrovi]|uniref:Uncharacterized protein n=1 Tax=Demequina mangrovi TaxID=1043493 RepID=A0A1H6W9S5_9MICO|nr:DUF4333 domain-containing protein [Demequina mangrovi]SEJ13653.1 protein of unknown function [Demequina mangrovi]